MKSSTTLSTTSCCLTTTNFWLIAGDLNCVKFLRHQRQELPRLIIFDNDVCSKPHVVVQSLNQIALPLHVIHRKIFVTECWRLVNFVVLQYPLDQQLESYQQFIFADIS